MLARKKLTTAPIVHRIFDSHAKWLEVATQLGLNIVPNVHEHHNSVTDVPFPLDAAYSASGNKIMGACFTEGIPFGWIRVSHKEDENGQG